jgi:hypothetical protein
MASGDGDGYACATVTPCPVDMNAWSGIMIRLVINRVIRCRVALLPVGSPAGAVVFSKLGEL